MTAFTLILPHLRNPGNDAALRIALDCLMTNTVNDFTLLMDVVRGGDLYETITRLVKHAPTEYCCYWASDTFAAPEWDVPMLALAAPDTFVNGVLVEPGAIGVHPESIHKDFGRKPETFRRAEFEEYVKDAPLPNGEGWYCPYMFPRDGWLAHGGLQSGLQGDHHGFTSADVELFDRWKASGNRIVRTRSYAYHMQRFSQLDEQSDPKRDIVHP